MSEGNTKSNKNKEMQIWTIERDRTKPREFYKERGYRANCIQILKNNQNQVNKEELIDEWERYFKDLLNKHTS